MKKYTCLLLACSCILQSVAAEHMAIKYTPLEEFIGDAANKYDVYFTIEGACPSNLFSDLLMIENVVTTNVPGDISAVISAVTNSITNLTVVREESNNHIYHIIDKRLFGMGDYPMGRVLESIMFQGDGWAFVNHIGAAFPNIVSQTGFSGMTDASNQETTISIDKLKVTLRDALSDGINLHGYDRIIWTAFTPLETHRTEVHFTGPIIDMEKF